MLRWLQSTSPSRYIIQIKQPLTNPYLGLALEEYWFKKLKFEDNKDVEKKLILLWRNQPSVVVGKFQNVWSECHTGFCRAHGIYVARRASGGGTHAISNSLCDTIIRIILYVATHAFTCLLNVAWIRQDSTWVCVCRVYHDPGNLNISIFSAHKHYRGRVVLKI